MIFTTVLYYLIALCMLLFSLFVFFPNNPVYAVLALVFNFVSVSFLLFMHGLDFLALSLIIVYVGAIAVLFLFVVMMLDIKEIMPSALENRSLPLLGSIFFFLSLIFAFESFVVFLFVLLISFIYLSFFANQQNFSLVSFNFFNMLLFFFFLIGFFFSLDFINLIATENFLFKAFENSFYQQNEINFLSLSENLFQGNSTNMAWTMEVDYFYSNIEALGQILYTEYVILFLLVGILLLAAMIGAIVLTLKINTDGLKQDMSTQLSVSHLKYIRSL